MMFCCPRTLGPTFAIFSGDVSFLGSPVDLLNRMISGS